MFLVSLLALYCIAYNTCLIELISSCLSNSIVKLFKCVYIGCVEKKFENLGIGIFYTISG